MEKTHKIATHHPGSHAYLIPQKALVKAIQKGTAEAWPYCKRSFLPEVAFLSFDWSPLSDRYCKMTKADASSVCRSEIIRGRHACMSGKGQSTSVRRLVPHSQGAEVRPIPIKGRYPVYLKLSRSAQKCTVTLLRVLIRLMWLKYGLLIYLTLT
jgi:hypothetical protein